MYVLVFYVKSEKFLMEYRGVYIFCTIKSTLLLLAVWGVLFASIVRELCLLMVLSTEMNVIG